MYPDHPCALNKVYVPFASDARIDQSEFKMSTKTGMDKLKKGYSVIKVEDPLPKPQALLQSPPTLS